MASGRDTSQAWRNPTPALPWADGGRPAAPAVPTRSVDFFGVRLDATLVPLAIAIRSTAIDEGRAGDLRRATAFRSTEGRADWQVRVYESAFQAASMGMVSGTDDARLADLERLYPDPDAVTLSRAAGEEPTLHASALRIAEPDAPTPDPWRQPEPADEEATLDMDDAPAGSAEPPPCAEPARRAELGGPAADGSPRAGSAPMALGVGSPDALSRHEGATATAILATLAKPLANLRSRARSARVRTAILADLGPLVIDMLAEGIGPADILAAMAEAGFPADARDIEAFRRG